jgi:hypothetical protein
MIDAWSAQRMRQTTGRRQSFFKLHRSLKLGKNGVRLTFLLYCTWLFSSDRPGDYVVQQSEINRQDVYSIRSIRRLSGLSQIHICRDPHRITHQISDFLPKLVPRMFDRKASQGSDRRLRCSGHYGPRKGCPNRRLRFVG